jgi:ribosomal protein S18 acetylase RimI-like enzyme
MIDLETLEPLTGANLSLVENLFSGIHRTAARLFAEASARHQAETWFYGSEVNRGAFSIVRQEDYLVCYAAFEQDPDHPGLLKDIDLLVSKAIAQRAEKPLFYNVRGDHLTLIQHLRYRGFKEDTTGFELVCDRKPSHPPALCQLDAREYQPEHFISYVHLLDGAFNPLIEQSGGKANAFERGQESLQKRLEARSKTGDFAAFWNEEALIGLYYLTDDVIDVLAVHPEYQNRGYGGILLRHAVHHLLAVHDFPAAYLFVVAANDNAKRMYLRHGFKISGHYSENTYVGINC